MGDHIYSVTFAYSMAYKQVSGPDLAQGEGITLRREYQEAAIVGVTLESGRHTSSSGWGIVTWRIWDGEESVLL